MRGHDSCEEDLARSACRGVMPVDEPVQGHRLKRTQLIRGEQLMENEQHALGQDLPVQSTALAYRARSLLVLVDPGHVSNGLDLRHDAVGGQLPVQDQLPGLWVVGCCHLTGEAFRPRRRGVESCGEVLDHGIGIPAPYSFGCRDDARVVPPYISQLSIDPLLVLPLVRRQLLLSLGLRALGSLPVPLEARSCFGLSLGPAACGPTALGLVVTEIGHGHRLCQRSGSEGLHLLGPHEGGGPEGRRLATRGKKTLQRRNLRVQLLRAP